MAWRKRLFNKDKNDSQSTTEQKSTEAVVDKARTTIELREGTAEFEEFVVRAELRSKDNLAHCAFHCANLLSYDPSNTEWLKLLEDCLSAAGDDPESLIPRGDELFYTTEALRAFIWQKQDRLTDAADLLINVTETKPEARYIDAWLLNWLEPHGAVEQLNEDLALRLFAILLNRSPESKYSTEKNLRCLRRWIPLFQRYEPRFVSPELKPMVRMLHAGLLRKAGLLEDALSLLQRAFETQPDWHTACAIGLVHRQQGKPDDAENAFQQAMLLNPSDISARLEAGDTFFENEHWQKALHWYETVLDMDADHEWAKPSAICCRWKTNEDERLLDELVALCRNENARAIHLYHQLFFGELPLPADATANILTHFREKILNDPENASSGEAKISLSSLEAPSNYLAFRLEMNSLKHDLNLTVNVDQIPQPDPREPICPLKFKIWKYDGTDPSPALPKPKDDVIRQICGLATGKFRKDESWAAASRIAEKLGPSHVVDLLATMTYPPEIPDRRPALEWLPRVQLAAAYVIAQIDEGWEGSVRREALLSVLFGPSDWATEAAIRALTFMGRTEEAIAPNISKCFEELSKHKPNLGYCCWETTLYSNWVDLPHLFDNEREDLRKKLRDIEEHYT